MKNSESLIAPACGSLKTKHAREIQCQRNTPPSRPLILAFIAHKKLHYNRYSKQIYLVCHLARLDLLEPIFYSLKSKPGWFCSMVTLSCPS